MFGLRFWALSIFYTVGSALLIGVPTVLIPNGFFRRMTPTSVQDYVIWSITAILIGLVTALATLYPMDTSQRVSTHSGGKRVLLGTVFSFLSVGCPVCNKLVILLLGFSGAMTFFNPLRPFLGSASIVVLSVTLFLRIRVLRHGCAVDFKKAAMTTRS